MNPYEDFTIGGLIGVIPALIILFLIGTPIKVILYICLGVIAMWLVFYTIFKSLDDIQMRYSQTSEKTSGGKN